MTWVLSDDGDENDVCDVDDNSGNACDYDFDEVVPHFELKSQNTETVSLSQVFPRKVIWEACCSLDNKMNVDLFYYFQDIHIRRQKEFDFINLLELTSCLLPDFLRSFLNSVLLYCPSSLVLFS